MKTFHTIIKKASCSTSPRKLLPELHLKTVRHASLHLTVLDNLPTTVRLTSVFLVGASLKSTRHLYWPASLPATSWTLRTAGKVSGRNWARDPSHFSSDQTSDVIRERPLPLPSPTSTLEKMQERNVAITNLKRNFEISKFAKFWVGYSSWIFLWSYVDQNSAVLCISKYLLN